MGTETEPLLRARMHGTPTDNLDWVSQLVREMATPSRRTVKNRSGRAGRKQQRGREWEQRTGGTRNLMAAIYAPADATLCRIARGSTTIEHFTVDNGDGTYTYDGQRYSDTINKED